MLSTHDISNYIDNDEISRVRLYAAKDCQMLFVE